MRAKSSNSAGVNSSRSSSGLFRKYYSTHASAPAKCAIALSVIDNLSSEYRYHFTVTVSVWSHVRAVAREHLYQAYTFEVFLSDISLLWA